MDSEEDKELQDLWFYSVSKAILFRAKLLKQGCRIIYYLYVDK